MTVQTDTERGLWLYDLDRRATLPLTLEGEIDWPTWWPDGRQLVFAWLRRGRYGAVLVSAAGGGMAPAWNRNGREIFFLGQMDAAWNRSAK